ncbi:hypothetical protein R1flu_010008 [Riccia fluitans]|uniref:Uncharacterized protein n=1 Tax=Riccia fluitans TaxID=41844 RepID=A0ABD1Z443_9MARC
MAPRSSKNLKTKEVKIPHLTVINWKKMESWALRDLFAVDWSGTYDNLLEELATKQKAAIPKFEYRGKPEEWTSEVWREVYNFTTFLRLRLRKVGRLQNDGKISVY